MEKLAKKHFWPKFWVKTGEIIQNEPNLGQIYNVLKRLKSPKKTPLFVVFLWKNGLFFHFLLTLSTSFPHFRWLKEPFWRNNLENLQNFRTPKVSFCQIWTKNYHLLASPCSYLEIIAHFVSRETTFWKALSKTQRFTWNITTIIVIYKN